MDEFRFTKASLDKVGAAAAGGRLSFKDRDGAGLMLRVSDSGTKTFMVRKKVAGRSVRVALGRYPEMTIEQARLRARKELTKLLDGHNPHDQRKVDTKRLITLAQVLDEFLVMRKQLKPRTAVEYRQIVDLMFADWKNRPILSITRDKVAERHATIGERSPSQANKGMRVLRALFNFAHAAYEDGSGVPLVIDNPVKRISKTRGWYLVRPKRSLIEPKQLKAWFDAVLNLKPIKAGDSSETVSEFLIFLLLTGLRREEAAALRWEEVDFLGQKFTVLDTKNGDVHVLPLSDYVLERLKTRKGDADDEVFVFASAESRRGYIQNPYKQMKRISEESGVDFSLHDLRRTFATTAERLDISPYTIKRLINHRLPADVTAGYIVIDVDRLRKPLEAISGFLLGMAGI